KERNHQVHIVDFRGNCKEFVNDVENRNLGLKILSPRYNPIIIKSSKNIFTVIGNIFDFYVNKFFMKRELEKYVKSNNIDLIIVNNYKTLSLLTKSNNYKIVFFARGWFNHNEIPTLKRALFKKNTDVYIGVSQAS